MKDNPFYTPEQVKALQLTQVKPTFGEESE
jgi:hypothetical protein